MTTAPPEVDATAILDDDGDEVAVNVFGEAPSDEPEADITAFGEASDEDSPYAFAEEDWPEAVKPEPKPKPANPFQAKIDAMLEGATLPTRAVVFTAPEADVKVIRGQIQRAAGERATAQVKVEKVDDTTVKIRFRLVDKIRRSRAAETATETPADEVPATSGDQSD